MRRVLLLSVTVLLASCSSSAPSTSATPTGSSSSSGSLPSTSTPVSTLSPRPPRSSTSVQSAPTGTVVTTATSAFGEILVDARGHAIYLFDVERSARAECYDACARAWPPVLTRGTPRARDVVRPALLGQTVRRDGTRQVTYAGHPLYFYAGEGPREVTCHRVSEFGGLWLVLDRVGNPKP